MAGVRLILKFQWKAYWRRFKRAGQLPQFDMLLLLLLGALFIFKLPPVLWRAARAGGRPNRRHGSAKSKVTFANYPASGLACCLWWRFVKSSGSARRIRSLISQSFCSCSQ